MADPAARHARVATAVEASVLAVLRSGRYVGGPVVDEVALIDALKSNKIFAAGLDVYEEEPKLKPGLADLPNVIIPPHIASATFETRIKMATMAAQNLIDALEGRMPEFCVNKDRIKL